MSEPHRQRHDFGWRLGVMLILLTACAAPAVTPATTATPQLTLPLANAEPVTWNVVPPTLTVEEYPIVSAAEDHPFHFEYYDRLTPDILDVRREWRRPRVAEERVTIGDAVFYVESDLTTATLYNGDTAVYTHTFGEISVAPIARRLSAWEGQWVLEALPGKVIIDGKASTSVWDTLKSSSGGCWPAGRFSSSAARMALACLMAARCCLTVTTKCRTICVASRLWLTPATVRRWSGFTACGMGCGITSRWESMSRLWRKEKGE